MSAAHAYDAVLMYARALTEVLAAEEDPKNGTAVMQRIRGHNFESLRGLMVRTAQVFVFRRDICLGVNFPGAPGEMVREATGKRDLWKGRD